MNTLNKMIKIKTKIINNNAIIPIRMHDSDAGFDLTASSMRVDEENKCIVFGTGLAFEIPMGYVMYVFPRSSCYKHGVHMANSVGVIDSWYRGEVHVVFNGTETDYTIGDRIAQAIIMPISSVEYVIADELEDSDRGGNGLGSTGV